MPNLYSGNHDGRVQSSTVGSWAGARDDTAGSANVSQVYSSYFTEVSKFASRGGGSSYRVSRSFIWFDTSGISGTVSAATIKIRGYNANDGSVIAVKSDAFGGDGGSALANADFNNIVGYSTGSSLAGNATDYSNTITSTSWSIGGYNDLTGTTDLKNDMKNNSVVIICFMDYTNDYLNSALGSNTTLNYGGYYTDYSGTSRDPYIEYTVATGYGNAVNGIASANIGKINGVATANIDKVNGI
tara:strand:- start:101 stop:829 length:729 start_codon:yes stop_codon:yes gene_type:complete